MFQKFQKHITTNFSFLKDKKLLIAISGGVDSVVLTHLLNQLKYNVTLAHCNFQLREKESTLEEEFIKELGKKLHIKTFTTQFNTKQIALKNKVSIQISARQLRYNWFNELAKKHNFNYILTAHHADDNLETFLINLTRGTGLEGLTGIPIINGKIVRPLLVFSREEIINYAKEHNINWQEDSSNSQTKYLRNKIRHQVVPILKEINPNLVTSFQKTSGFLNESKQIIKDRIEDISKQVIEKNNSTTSEIIKINSKKLQTFSNPKAYLYQLLHTYEFTEWEDVYHLLSAQSGKQIFSKTHRLLKNRDFLILLEKKTITNEFEDFFIQKNQSEIQNPICLKIEKTKNVSFKGNNIILIDKDLLKFPLIIRKWRKGDYFCPSGMNGRKKLSKFFKDEKLSLFDKENTWLLCNSENTIIWIVGKRQDHRFIITHKTTNILKITYQV